MKQESSERKSSVEQNIIEQEKVSLLFCFSADFQKYPLPNKNSVWLNKL